METVVVAFESAGQCAKMRELIESDGLASCIVCHSGAQVRRALAAQTVYCVVCGCNLSDGQAAWLCEDLPATCSMLMVGASNQLSLCDHPDVVKLATPASRTELLSAVRLLIQFGHRLERLLRPRRSPLERELVERAKALLMTREGLSEQEAHRTLQRRSMDSGLRVVQVARQVLAEAEKR